MDRILCFMFVFFGGGTGCLTRLLVDGTETYAFSPSNVAACILIGVTSPRATALLPTSFG